MMWSKQMMTVEPCMSESVMVPCMSESLMVPCMSESHGALYE